MTIQKLPAILDRIAQASRESPLAVFSVGKSPDLFDAIPANTITAQQRMKGPHYIGSFCGHDYDGEIRKAILEAV